MTASLSRTDLLQALAVVVIWGSNFVVMKLGLQGLHPMLLGALRFLAASLPWLLLVRAPALPWRLVAAYGVVQGFGQFGLLFTALQWGMPAGMASVLMQTQAFFTLLLAAPLLGERLQRHQWGGLALAAAGLAALGLAQGGGVASIGPAALLLTLGAALLWAVSNLIVRHASRQCPDYDPLAFVVWSSLVPIGPFGALALQQLGAAEAWRQVAGMGWRGGLSALFLAWFATLLAYSLWTGLLKRHPAGRVAPFSLLVPVVGLAAAGAVFGERLSAGQWAGTAAVMAGLLVNQAGGRRRAAAPAPRQEERAAGGHRPAQR